MRLMRLMRLKELAPKTVDGTAYYPAAAVARALGVSRQTLWRWRHEERIPLGRRFRDGQILFTEAEVEAIRTYANRLEPALINPASAAAEDSNHA
jgi:transposase-like protein